MPHPHHHPTLVFFYNGQSNRYKAMSYHSFNWHPSGDYLCWGFICLLVIHIFSFERYLFLPSMHELFSRIAFWVPYICSYEPLYPMHSLQIFSPLYTLLHCSVNCFFGCIDLGCNPILLLFHIPLEFYTKYLPITISRNYRCLLLVFYNFKSCL